MRHYPTRVGAAWINRRLDFVFNSTTRPVWLLAPGKGKWPTMVLNMSTSLQRKFFYFPKVYGRFYGNNSFANYLERTLTAGATFLEIGANVGFFTLLAAKLVGPRGRVYAFEPEPDICEALVRSARANSFAHVEAFELALSDHEAEAVFYRARDGTASSLVPEAPGHEQRYERTLRARLTTLDQLVSEGRIDPAGISVIKVDVEGAEVRTIGGMLATLPAAGYPPIWCEVRGPNGSTRAPDTYRGVHAQLARLGYEPYRWDAGAPVKISDADVMQRTDVLFQREASPR